MNIDEIMEMVMANEDVKNLSHKEKRAARPAFFCHIWPLAYVRTTLRGYHHKQRQEEHLKVKTTEYPLESVPMSVATCSDALNG